MRKESYLLRDWLVKNIVSEQVCKFANNEQRKINLAESLAWLFMKFFW